MSIVFIFRLCFANCRSVPVFPRGHAHLSFMMKESGKAERIAMWVVALLFCQVFVVLAEIEVFEELVSFG